MTWNHCPVGYNTLRPRHVLSLSVPAAHTSPPCVINFCDCFERPPQRLLRRSRYIFRKRGQDIFHTRLYSTYLLQYTDGSGHGVAQLLEALRQKPDGRGFDTRWYDYGPRITGTLRKYMCTFIIISG